ncbi:hypothetical protein HPB47_014945, partial [Ixodes persulcatus]
CRPFETVSRVIRRLTSGRRDIGARRRPWPSGQCGVSQRGLLGGCHDDGSLWLDGSLDFFPHNLGDGERGRACRSGQQLLQFLLDDFTDNVTDAEEGGAQHNVFHQSVFISSAFIWRRFLETVSAETERGQQQRNSRNCSSRFTPRAAFRASSKSSTHPRSDARTAVQEELFVNKHYCHSINVQLIVDARSKILNMVPCDSEASTIPTCCRRAVTGRTSRRARMAASS